jgi:hypothetical protein
VKGGKFGGRPFTRPLCLFINSEFATPARRLLNSLRHAWAPSNTTDMGSVPKRVERSVDVAMNADSKSARFSAAALPCPFPRAAWLCPCRLQQGTNGAHGPGEAVGAVGALFHVGNVRYPEWGHLPLPLHAVRVQRCGHLVLFRTKSRPRPRCGSLFRTCPGTKEATSKARQRQQPRPSRMTPNTGVYVACVPVSLRHACLYRCRLLQRDQHDAVCLLVSCLLVFVLHACSCLYRNWQRGSKVQGALELVRH